MTTLKKYITLHQLVRINLEGEYVYGIFVEDVFVPTKIAFKSVICPDFIKKDNAISGDDEESGMTGFYCEIDSVLHRDDNLYIAFPSINREIFFHYVEVIESIRQLG
jgi:hypothetical protein